MRRSRWRRAAAPWGSCVPPAPSRRRRPPRAPRCAQRRARPRSRACAKRQACALHASRPPTGRTRRRAHARDAAGRAGSASSRTTRGSGRSRTARSVGGSRGPPSPSRAFQAVRRRESAGRATRGQSTAAPIPNRHCRSRQARRPPLRRPTAPATRIASPCATGPGPGVPPGADRSTPRVAPGRC